MLGSIKYNLAHLLDFTGRDARQTFWYYVLAVYIAQVAISLAITVPVMIGAIGRSVELAQAGADPETLNQAAMSSMGDLLPASIWLSLVLGGVMVALLAASFVRRLHDSDHSGLWALLVLAFFAGSTLLTYSMMGDMREVFTQAALDPVASQQRILSNAKYGVLNWIGLGLVILFGVLKSTEGPNRFGEAPVRF